MSKKNFFCITDDGAKLHNVYLRKVTWASLKAETYEICVRNETENCSWMEGMKLNKTLH
jgi:hypothetical protein